MVFIKAIEIIIKKKLLFIDSKKEVKIMFTKTLNY